MGNLHSAKDLVNPTEREKFHAVRALKSRFTVTPKTHLFTKNRLNIKKFKDQQQKE